jgi:hypothetical protein
MSDPHAELAAAALAYQRAVTRTELADRDYRNGEMLRPEYEAAYLGRAEAKARFDDARRALAERCLEMMLCLAAHDPGAMARVWGELGIPSALAGFREQLDEAHRELARLRAKVVEYRHAVIDLHGRYDRLEADWVEHDLRLKGDDGF